MSDRTVGDGRPSNSWVVAPLEDGADSRWTVFYTEKGIDGRHEYFDTEDDACQWAARTIGQGQGQGGWLAFAGPDPFGQLAEVLLVGGRSSG